ncbi:MAG TPA: tetratricopeptide repeat protein, partial [Lacipirellulaceae bacterium]|nr:tetratricopeptide repeat protein [Lacipirellulaceae bacterium]
MVFADEKAPVAEASGRATNHDQAADDRSSIDAKTAGQQLQFVPASDAENRAQIETFSRHLQQSPRDVDALIARGSALQAIREFEKGEADLAAAVELAPERPDAWRAYGQCCLNLGKFPEAIGAFDKAIALKPRDPRAFLWRAMAYRMNGEMDQAMVSVSSAIERDPTDGDAYFTRAQWLAEMDQWNEALADYAEAIEVEPSRLVFRSGRARAYFKRREFEKGLEDVTAAMRLNPGDVGVNYQPTSDRKLSPESLAHGEEQVRKMLKDRPVMAEHVTEGDAIWTWAVRKFAGEDTGMLVDWNAGSTAPFRGFSSLPVGGRNAFIQVGSTLDGLPDGRSATFDELWSTAVFE